MSIDDLQRGLEALDDEAVRQSVAAGESGVLADLELTDGERALLEAAASVYPEVVGMQVSSWTANIISKIRLDPSITSINKVKTADKAQKVLTDYLRG